MSILNFFLANKNDEWWVFKWIWRMFPFLKLFIPVFCDLDKLSICCILYCDLLTIQFIIFYLSFNYFITLAQENACFARCQLTSYNEYTYCSLKDFQRQSQLSFGYIAHLKRRLVKKHFFVVISINYGILLNVSVMCKTFEFFIYFHHLKHS